MPPSEEARWIAKARGGEEAAFARLVERYSRPVFNLCYRMLGDAGDAEEAAQETFLKAFLKLKRYDPSRPFPTWLLSIAAHHCIDQFRRRKFQVTSLDALYRRPSGRESAPEQVAERAQEQEALQAELARLGPTERAAIVLRYWYDLSYEEIGQSLGLSVSAVKSRLHRARRELATRTRIQPRRAGKERTSVTPA